MHSRSWSDGGFREKLAMKKYRDNIKWMYGI